MPIRLLVKRASFIFLMAVVICGCSDGSDNSAPLTGWEPYPSSYGMTVVRGIDITMDDGVILHANVGYPTELNTDARAAGTFPVLLTQNPYGGGENPDPYFVTRGYIHAVTEVRGTGQSQLSMEDPDGPLSSDNLGQRDALDGAALVDWAADIDGSNGRLGLYGCSALGIIQILTAGELDHMTPVKAMVPACGGQSYSTYFVGGVASKVVDLFDMTGNGGAKHAAENLAAGRALKQDILAGGERAFNREYWLERTSDLRVGKIVANDIPTLLWTGWNALEGLTGGIDLYSALQNAAQGRPTFGPMDPNGGASSGRFQIVVGPGGHGAGIDKELQLRWYDHWVKQQNTGIDQSGTGMHLYELGGDRWINQTSWPITDEYTAFYLSDHGLDSTQVYYSVQLAFGNPEDAGTTVAYETQPFDSDQSIAGPSNATLFILSSNTNAHFVTTLYDVAPDGTAFDVTSGGLIASARNLDNERSWYDVNGLAIKPEGTFNSSMLLTPDTLYRLDIEFAPTLYRVPAGHYLRLLVATQASAEKCGLTLLALTRPSPCLFNEQQLPTLEGGVYTIISDSSHPSSLNVPLVDPDSLLTARSGMTETSPNQSQPLDWGGPGE